MSNYLSIQHLFNPKYQLINIILIYYLFIHKQYVKIIVYLHLYFDRFIDFYLIYSSISLG